MLLMFRYGLREIWTDQHRLKLLVLYLLAALTFSIVPALGTLRTAGRICSMRSAGSRSASASRSLCLAGWQYSSYGLGRPPRRKVSRTPCIGLVNHAGEVPLLVAVRQDETDDAHSNITVLEFLACGVPKSVWEQKSADIETALNVHVAYIQECDG